MATRHLDRTRSDGADPDAVISRAAGHLVAMFNLRDCRFEPFPFDTQLPRIEPARIVLPAAEPGLAPWSLDGGIELPIRSLDLTVGRFVLLPRTRTSGVALSPSRRANSIALAADVGNAIAAQLQTPGRARL